MSSIPVIARELANLQSLGIDGRMIGIQNVSLQSGKYVTVMEKDPSRSVLCTVDLTRPGMAPQRKPIPVDSGIMHPTKNILALRAPQPGSNPAEGLIVLQVVDMDKNDKKAARLTGQKVQYWRWVSETTLGIVTETAYFEWKVLEGQAEPTQLFARDPSMSGCQIIDTRTSTDGEFVAVVGIKGSASGTGIDGLIQLFLRSKGVASCMEGYAVAFAAIQLPGRPGTASIMAVIRKTPAGPRLFVAENGGGGFKVQGDLVQNPADVGLDLPIGMDIASEHGFAYVVTKAGFVHMFDLVSGQNVFRHRLTDRSLFCTCQSIDKKGIITIVQQTGQVYAVSINEATFIPYLIHLGKAELGLDIANRNGLPGADDLMKTQLDSLIASGNVKGAAELCANSKPLRCPETIEKFRALPAVGGAAPLLLYFSTISQRGKLNKYESLELAKMFIASGRKELLDKWVAEDKFEPSKEFGDLLQTVDPTLALRIYHSSGEAHDKVVETLIRSNQYDKVVAYCQKTGYQADYRTILGSLVSTAPDAAKEMALRLLKNESGPLVDIQTVVDAFLPVNIQVASSFLIDALNGDRPQDAALQTKFFEISFNSRAYQVIDAVFDSNMFSHFDKKRVGALAEANGMFGRALQCYAETGMMDDVKRVIVHTESINADFMIKFFGTLPAEVGIECMRQLLLSDMRRNVELVVHIGQAYSEVFGEENIIKVLDDFHLYDGLFFYLGHVINTSINPTVHFRYIEAAVRMGQWPIVEKVCRESQYYDPVKVKEFLIKEKLKDPRPLIYVCHNHGYVEEMTEYLFKNNMQKFIEVYLSSIAPENTPKVVGKMLDLNAPEDTVKILINNIGRRCSVEEMVTVFEARNRLRLLYAWLEQRVQEGDCQTVTHNALGKIYVTMNKDPQKFLTTNRYYDSRVLGEFCTKLDPYLAFLAYKRAGGECDEELLDVTSKNDMFKDQSRYLIQRQDPNLWAMVLNPDNEYRQRLVDAIVGTALAEIERPEEVSSTVQAFIDADLQSSLIDLLEKLVLHGTKFADNSHLQTILLKTAIACTQDDSSIQARVMEYIHRLDNFDPNDIAPLALDPRYNLFDEAFEIYKKFNLHVEAIGVLINRMGNLELALSYAEKVDLPSVWSLLAGAQLEAEEPKNAIASYLRAEDPTNYRAVITAGNRENLWEEVIDFILMARKTIKEKFVDTALLYAYARAEKFEELETFISTPNTADIQSVGDQCFDEASYEAAKILFSSINNNAKLASCRVHLGEYREAVEAAKKANSLKTWQEVCTACVEAGEFKLAAVCGVRIIIAPDYLDDLIKVYEASGSFDELITLMEQGITLEDAHVGIFTELSILYSKYKPETNKLIEHITVNWSKMNIQKVIRACESGFQWKEAAFLYEKAEDFDSAVRTMIEYPVQAFEHEKFLDLIPRVRNQEYFYRAIDFYLRFQPMQLVKLLMTLKSKLEHSRVVHQVKKTDDIPLIMPYLTAVQPENIIAVNDAINSSLIDDENYEGLRTSIDSFDKFDQLAMANRLQDHELLEFRRIAAYLYKRNKRFKLSIDLSKENHVFADAIDAAAASKDSDLVEDLLRYFVEKKNPESFCATLYTCYEFVSPDVAIELAWRNQLVDYAMPFIIQYVKHTHEKIKELDKRTQPKKDEENEDNVISAAPTASMLMSNAPLAITDGSMYMDPAMQMQQQMAMGMNPMMGQMDPSMGMGMGMNPMMGQMDPSMGMSSMMGQMDPSMGMNPMMGGMGKW